MIVGQDDTSIEIINDVYENILQSKFADVTRQDSEEIVEISIFRVWEHCA